MARTPPNGRSPSISMSDFNARVKRVLEGNEEVTRGAPRATPGWSRRRNTRPPVGAEAQPEAETSEATESETESEDSEAEKQATEEA
ncbi:hypothetical protein [Methylobacterium sp. WL120]|uniref:hypothetical protein n=1 Tax=Methylobacterium sp. WL120 TaxID=2603887 RepID=UPI0011CBBAAA|nr:hypothetical protein [Methylobacterium sp. WL120]TXM67371.1 hypothetical protein FV229_10375 [Methylobacterium sp. WL120]